MNVRYLETHLGRAFREYIELVQCYCEAGNKDGAREIAERGLKECKDDLTELFIFLLRDAETCNDDDRYKKLYASARRRKMADFARINEGICGKEAFLKR